MRVLAILTFLATFLNFTADAQQTFFLCVTENKEGYYFSREDTLGFVWFRFENDLMEFGNGTFQETTDSIKLTFMDARKQFDVEETTTPVTRGKETVVIEFTDAGGQPLAGLQVKLEKSGLKGMTDENGIAQLDTRGTMIYQDMIDFRFENYRTAQRGAFIKGNRLHFTLIADKGRKYKENQLVSLKWTTKGKGFEIIDGVNKKYFKRVTRKRFLDLYHGFKK